MKLNSLIRTGQSADRLMNFTGISVMAVISILGLYTFFVQAPAMRWPALALVSLLILLALLAHYSDWCEGHRQRQRWLLALRSGLVVALLALPPHLDIFIILFFVLSVTAAMLFEPREWVWWIAVFAAITAVYYIRRYGWSAGISSTVIYGAAYYFFASFAKASDDALTAQQESLRLYEELRVAHERLRDYADQVEVLTIVQERQRMAREMHDTVGHRLTVAAVQLQAARQIVDRDPQKTASMIDTVHQQITAALTELRQTVAALRAPLEEDLSLPQSLQHLIHNFAQATDIDCKIELPPDLPPLSARLRTAFHRAAQECLTNVQKHAAAKHVWLQLRLQDTMLCLTVTDDGRGLSPHLDGRGFGLKGLHERAVQVGGTFQLQNLPQGGTRAIFCAPLSSPTPAEHDSRKESVL